MNNGFFSMHNTKVLKIFSLLLIIGLVTACGQNTGFANRIQSVISVSGQGSASASPDVAYVNLGVDFTGSNLSDVLSEANKAMDLISQAANDKGIDKKDLQTANFNVWIEDPRNKEGQALGMRVYHVDSSLRVTIREIDKAGEVIGAAVDAGANRVYNLSFGIDDTSALESKARKLALSNARAKAEEMASELGVKVGKPISVSESFENRSSQIPRFEKAAFDQSILASGPSINQGELSVSVNVYLDFELLP